MNVTLLISPSDQQPGHTMARSVGSHLLDGICATVPVFEYRQVELAAKPLRLHELDLVVIATAVGHGPASTLLLDALAEPDALAGCVAFLAAVGPWPGEVGTADRILRPRIQNAGALCLAPTLHVVDDSRAPIDTYCRYWRAAVVALAAHAKSPEAAA